MEIYFVRHTSVNVPAGFAYGQTDVGLADSFIEEASETLSKLSAMKFDHVWTSPLTRCKRLAAFCGYSDADCDDRLKEIAFGEWEMSSWDKLKEDARSQSWYEDWINVPAPGGESLLDQFFRVYEFIEEIRHSNYEKVCVFTHAGVITCAGIYSGLYSFRQAFKNVPPFGSINCLHFDRLSE